MGASGAGDRMTTARKLALLCAMACTLILVSCSSLAVDSETGDSSTAGPAGLLPFDSEGPSQVHPALPPEWPADLSLPAGFVVDDSEVTDHTSSETVSISGPYQGTIDDVERFVATELSEWSRQRRDANALEFTSGDRELVATVADNGERRLTFQHSLG